MVDGSEWGTVDFSDCLQDGEVRSLPKYCFIIQVSILQSVLADDFVY